MTTRPTRASAANVKFTPRPQYPHAIVSLPPQEGVASAAPSIFNSADATFTPPAGRKRRGTDAQTVPHREPFITWQLETCDRWSSVSRHYFELLVRFAEAGTFCVP